MKEELEVLKIVTSRLNDLNISYLISGSIAGNYYTVPRMTRDIDIVIELTTSDINKFIDVFLNDFYLDKNMIENEVSRKGMFNIIHNEHIIKIDFILPKDTDFQRSVLLRKKNVIIDNAQMWLISAEDLILMKLLWAKESHSEMQLKDVSNMIATISNIDMNYIETWIKMLGLEQLLIEAKKSGYKQ